jgi:hypothetical protein
MGKEIQKINFQIHVGQLWMTNGKAMAATVPAKLAMKMSTVGSTTPCRNPSPNCADCILVSTRRPENSRAVLENSFLIPFSK